MSIRGDWTTNEVLTSDDLNDTVNDKISVSAIGTALPLNVDKTAASAGTATDLSRVDHRHLLSDHAHGSTTGGNIPMTSVTDMTTAWAGYTLEYSPYLSGWALGNAGYTSRWKRFGRTYFWNVEIQFGSTSTFGTGRMAFRVPAGLDGYQVTSVHGHLTNGNGGGLRYALLGYAQFDASYSILDFYYHGSTSAGVTATSPFTLDANSSVYWSAVLEAEYAS